MLKVPSSPLPIEGLHWSQTKEAILVTSEAPLDCLCSGMAGGGFQSVRHILNLHVDKDYAGTDPAGDLRACAQSLGVDEPFAGLMTAAWVHKARPFYESEEGIGVCVLATIGLGNATSSGISPPARWNPGTINIIVLIDANLTPAALVNLVVTITEAKCDFLRRLGWKTTHGETATGTSTDAVAVAATGRGVPLPYAGPATIVGWLAARLVRQALEAYS